MVCVCVCVCIYNIVYIKSAMYSNEIMYGKIYITMV